MFSAYFHNPIFALDEPVLVATMTPVVHYVRSVSSLTFLMLTLSSRQWVVYKSTVRVMF